MDCGEEGTEAASGTDQQPDMAAGQARVWPAGGGLMVQGVSACLGVVRETRDQDTWSSRKGLVWFWKGDRATCVNVEAGMKQGGTAFTLEMWFPK